MKIALFSCYVATHETSSYHESAKKHGHQLDFIPLQSLVIKLPREGGLEFHIAETVETAKAEAKKEGVELNIVDAGTDLSKYDAVIIRGANRSEEPQRAKYKPLIYQYYSDRGIPVLNGRSNVAQAGNKLFQHWLFSVAGVPVVPTVWSASEDNLEEATKDFEFPVFVKEERGSHGTKTDVPANVDELKIKYNDVPMPAYLLIQKKLEMNWDIRVIVVGNKVLGGMKRTAAEGAHVSNFSAGGSIEVVELSDEEKSIALKAAKALDAEYGGADLMKDEEGNIHVLEFNRNASFKGFEQATEIDVPKEVFDYLDSQRKNG